MEKSQEVSSQAEDKKPPYDKEFLGYSSIILTSLNGKIDMEMHEPYQPGGKLVQPIIKNELFTRDVAKSIVSGENLSKFGFRPIFENFLSAYSTNNHAVADYLWGCLSLLATETELLVISEKIEKLERSGEPLRPSKILKDSNSAVN